MQDQDDAAMVARTANGDTSAFEVSYPVWRALFRVAFRMLGDYDDARDATQSAFIKVYQRVGTFDPRFRFFSWIYRILLNECLNARRDWHQHEDVRDFQPRAVSSIGWKPGSPGSRGAASAAGAAG